MERNASASGRYSPSRVSVSRISSARARSRRPSAFTSAKIVLARASGTSAAISSTADLALPGVQRELLDLHRDARDIRAQRFHQQIERGRFRCGIRRAADQRLGFPPRVLAGEYGAAPPRRGWPRRTCGRDPACACRRLRNRSGWLRRPATTPGVGFFRYSASGRGVAGAGAFAVVVLRRGGALPLGSAASALHDPDQPLGSEQRERARVVHHLGQRDLGEIVLGRRRPRETRPSSASLMRRRS